MPGLVGLLFLLIPFVLGGLVALWLHRVIIVISTAIVGAGLTAFGGAIILLVLGAGEIGIVIATLAWLILIVFGARDQFRSQDKQETTGEHMNPARVHDIGLPTSSQQPLSEPDPESALNEPDATDACNRCEETLLADARFCMHCGVEVRRKRDTIRCGPCGEPVDRGDRFCMNCGQAIHTSPH